jgi:hypothetical protein
VRTGFIAPCDHPKLGGAADTRALKLTSQVNSGTQKRLPRHLARESRFRELRRPVRNSRLLDAPAIHPGVDGSVLPDAPAPTVPHGPVVAVFARERTVRHLHGRVRATVAGGLRARVNPTEIYRV